MAVERESKIDGAGLQEYIHNKDYDCFQRFDVRSGAFSNKTIERNGYFWIRNNTDFFDYVVYAPATTYAKHERSHYDGKVWRSLVAANIGHQPDTSPTFWAEVYDTTTTSETWCNLRMDIGYISHGNGEVDFDIWEVTWLAGVEQLNHIINIDRSGPQLSPTQDLWQLPPGYYKYRTYAKAPWGSHVTIVNFYYRRSDNNIERGENVRIWDTTFKELQTINTTEPTFQLAQAGRFGSPDYLGGDYEGL